MSDFLESAKQKLEHGISRMSWEADKLRRVNAKQGEINTLKEKREQALVDFSNVVLSMYRQGQLTDPKFRVFCERILDLESEMTTKTAELEQLRGENYQAARGAGGNPADSMAGRTARPSSGMPPMGAGATPGAGSTDSHAEPAFCPTCGEPVRSRALYCNKCGTKLR